MEKSKSFEEIFSLVDDKLSCYVCHKSRNDFCILIPCGDFICQECGTHAEQCPICGQDIRIQTGNQFFSLTHLLILKHHIDQVSDYSNKSSNSCKIFETNIATKCDRGKRKSSVIANNDMPETTKKSRTTPKVDGTIHTGGESMVLRKRTPINYTPHSSNKKFQRDEGLVQKSKKMPSKLGKKGVEAEPDWITFNKTRPHITPVIRKRRSSNVKVSMPLSSHIDEQGQAPFPTIMTRRRLHRNFNNERYGNGSESPRQYFLEGDISDEEDEFIFSSAKKKCTKVKRVDYIKNKPKDWVGKTIVNVQPHAFIPPKGNLKLSERNLSSNDYKQDNYTKAVVALNKGSERKNDNDGNSTDGSEFQGFNEANNHKIHEHKKFIKEFIVDNSVICKDECDRKESTLKFNVYQQMTVQAPPLLTNEGCDRECLASEKNESPSAKINEGSGPTLCIIPIESSQIAKEPHKELKSECIPNLVEVSHFENINEQLLLFENECMPLQFITNNSNMIQPDKKESLIMTIAQLGNSKELERETLDFSFDKIPCVAVENVDESTNYLHNSNVVDEIEITKEITLDDELVIDSGKLDKLQTGEIIISSTDTNKEKTDFSEVVVCSELNKHLFTSQEIDNNSTGSFGSREGTDVVDCDEACEIKKLKDDEACEIKKLKDYEACEIKKLKDDEACEIKKLKDDEVCEIKKLKDNRHDNPADKAIIGMEEQDVSTSECSNSNIEIVSLKYHKDISTASVKDNLDFSDKKEIVQSFESKDSFDEDDTSQNLNITTSVLLFSKENEIKNMQIPLKEDKPHSPLNNCQFENHSQPNNSYHSCNIQVYNSTHLLENPVSQQQQINFETKQIDNKIFLNDNSSVSTDCFDCKDISDSEISSARGGNKMIASDTDSVESIYQLHSEGENIAEIQHVTCEQPSVHQQFQVTTAMINPQSKELEISCDVETDMSPLNRVTITDNNIFKDEVESNSVSVTQKIEMANEMLLVVDKNTSKVEPNESRESVFPHDGNNQSKVLTETEAASVQSDSQSMFFNYEMSSEVLAKNVGDHFRDKQKMCHESTNSEGFNNSLCAEKAISEVKDIIPHCESLNEVEQTISEDMDIISNPENDIEGPKQINSEDVDIIHKSDNTGSVPFNQCQYDIENCTPKANSECNIISIARMDSGVSDMEIDYENNTSNNFGEYKLHMLEKELFNSKKSSFIANCDIDLLDHEDTKIFEELERACDVGDGSSQSSTITSETCSNEVIIYDSFDIAENQQKDSQPPKSDSEKKVVPLLETGSPDVIGNLNGSNIMMFEETLPKITHFDLQHLVKPAFMKDVKESKRQICSFKIGGFLRLSFANRKIGMSDFNYQTPPNVDDFNCLIDESAHKEIPIRSKSIGIQTDIPSRESDDILTTPLTFKESVIDKETPTSSFITVPILSKCQEVTPITESESKRIDTSKVMTLSTVKETDCVSLQYSSPPRSTPIKSRRQLDFEAKSEEMEDIDIVEATPPRKSKISLQELSLNSSVERTINGHDISESYCTAGGDTSEMSNSSSRAPPNYSISTESNRKIFDSNLMQQPLKNSTKITVPVPNVPLKIVDKKIPFKRIHQCANTNIYKEQIIFTTSRLGATDRAKIIVLSEKIGGTFSDQFTDNTTYLIVADRDIDEIKTQKVLMAIATRTCIVTIKWVEDSLKNDRLMPIKSYVPPSHGPLSCLNSVRKPLFDGFSFFVHPYAISSSDEGIAPSHEDIKKVLKLCGGIILSDLTDDLNAHRQKICICDPDKEIANELIDRCCELHVLLIDSNWVYNSVFQYELIDISSYVKGNEFEPSTLKSVITQPFINGIVNTSEKIH